MLNNIKVCSFEFSRAFAGSSLKQATQILRKNHPTCAAFIGRVKKSFLIVLNLQKNHPTCAAFIGRVKKSFLIVLNLQGVPFDFYVLKKTCKIRRETRKIRRNA